MGKADQTVNQARIPVAVFFYYGWIIVELIFLASLPPAGTRSVLSVLVHP